jgi:methionyl-tRNA formyltransferase
MFKEVAVLTSGLNGYKMLLHLKTIKLKVTLIIIDKKESSKRVKEIKKMNLSENILFADKNFNKEIINLIKLKKIKLILSFWWPYIIKHQYIKLTKFGILNPHTGYLPFERGVHSYVYSIMRKHQKGVTLHFMEKDVDCGYIYKQKKLKTDEFVTAKYLENKGTSALLDFYKKNLKNLVNLKFNKLKMNKASNKTIQNLRKDLDKNTKIDLNKKYKALDLIYLLLSRSGFKKGGAHFDFKNKSYEIDIKIRKKK